MQLILSARKDFLKRLLEPMSFLMRGMTYFASESVCAGHPDKICDQISDAILDEALRSDRDSRIAIEALASKNSLIIAGEIQTAAKLDLEAIARKQIKRLGYTKQSFNFSDKSPVILNVHEQSQEIIALVKDEGAGDQGMMFGFACTETPELMPLPIMLAHRLVNSIDMAREDKLIAGLLPDGKAQVVVRYVRGRPVAVEHVVVAAAHSHKTSKTELKNELYRKVVKPSLAAYGFEVSKAALVVNGGGLWHTPGPASDTGLTGRKIVVDSYGGYARVGGGAFSGKDATKVDRSGAYAARFIAKNIVAAGLSEKCEVGLAYYIGGHRPVMMEIDTFDTAKYSRRAINDFAQKLIDPSVAGIIERLGLRQPIYLQTATYGHFGKPDLPWESIVNGV